MITLQQGTIYMGTAAPASGGGGSGDAVWGSITGTLSNQTDLATALAGKQDTLTAGTGIDITNNVISATGGATSVENKNTAVGATNPLNLWEGTSAEYASGGGSQTWYNWQSGTASWVSETSGISTKLNALTYGNNKFIAVGDSGIILSSSDSSSWNTETSGVSTNLKGVTYNSSWNKFIAVGASGTILSSADGSTWTNENPNGDITTDFNGVKNGVILGDGGVCYNSSNGSTWNLLNTSQTTTENLNDYATMYHDASGVSSHFIVGNNGTIIRNTGNITTNSWESVFTGVSANFNSITNNSYNRYVIVGDNGTIFNALGSGSITPPQTSGTNDDLVSVIWANNKFYALGASGILLSSSNGSTWTQEISDNSYNLTSLAYNNKVVAVGNSGTILSYSGNSTALSCFTTEAEPTTESTVYSAPNTTSTLTITAVGTGTITLSDTNTYNYNASGNQTTTQSVGEAHPDWICLIEGVGIKKGNTTIAY